MGQLEGGLGVLADPIEVGSLGREGGGELDVLLLEDQEGGLVRFIRGGVEEDVTGGLAGHGEPEGGGAVERECEVRVGVGQKEGMGRV